MALILRELTPAALPASLAARQADGVDETGRVLGRERVRAALWALRTFWVEHRRLHERQQLRLRPWEEEFLHFAPDGRLHGHLPPPGDGRRSSVTADGWCPGWARQVGRPTTVAGSGTP